MSTINDAAEVIGRYVHTDFAEDAARDLAAEGHLTPDPPELAQTIAGMRWEWGVEQATGTTTWFGSRPMAEAHAEVRGAFRIVRRLVGPKEVAE